MTEDEPKHEEMTAEGDIQEPQVEEDAPEEEHEKKHHVGTKIKGIHMIWLRQYAEDRGIDDIGVAASQILVDGILREQDNGG